MKLSASFINVQQQRDSKPLVTVKVELFGATGRLEVGVVEDLLYIFIESLPFRKFESAVMSKHSAGTVEPLIELV